LEKAAKSYLLVVRMEETVAADAVEGILKRENMHFKLSALTKTEDYAEAVYEVAFQPKHRGAVEALGKLAGVRTISLVDCRKN